MESIRGYYSIIQYCPDRSRLEAVNIGVALYCPQIRFLRARFGRRRTQITRLFGKQDWEFVALQQSAIEARLTLAGSSFERLEDFEDYIARRANSLVLSNPRPMKVLGDPERELKHLLKRLVGSQSTAVSEPVSVMTKELGGLFQEAGVVSRLERNVTIKPPALPKPIRAPFAYRNGRLNLIELIEFEQQSAAGVFNRASVHAVEGAFISDYRDPQYGDLALVVVGKFGAAQKHEQETARTIFEQHGVRMHAFGNVGPLIEEIRREAH